MQDETSQATMSLMIRSGQITARTLRDAIRQILMKRDVLETRVRDSSTEKQTLRTLVRDGSEMTNIRVSRENIGDFEYIARKYDIDYSLKRDRSGEEPCYRVFFRARDWETLFNALEEYARRTELRRDRAEEPLSVQRQLERYRETARIRSRGERTRIPRYREELR